ncbi:protocadherin-11 X-linked-like isoform X2 [Gigantopelta aegis]|uniref:protocadherin-11 X-linked-like isoform X2 n=1 Tax=Gigantopelta aegis TaxID=1735272 RepID=UPI001B88C1CD|nr:protocadherin-11 X-linked-like isoform X2 [Gigantopelta aegis]
MAAISALLLVLSTTCSVRALTRVFRVPEGPSPARIGDIANTDNLTSVAGCAQLSSLRYSLISQEDGHHLLFKVNETTGDFATVVALDRENITACAFLSECPLHVSVAVQSAIGTCFQKVSVVVILIDVNDNAPQFAQPIVRRELYENAPVGSEMSLPLAHDRDANTVFQIHSYSLSPSSSPFSLVYTRLQDGSVSLMLRLSAILDRETTSEYSLHVTAFDGGRPPRSGDVLVIVAVQDINDNAPHFTEDEYQVSVPENSKIGSTVFFLSATDLDFDQNGVIAYDFANPKQEAVTKHFLVDPKAGSITIKGSLENEGGNVFNFSVLVTDGGNPVLSSEARVVISVLDTGNNRPQIIIQLLFSESGSATVSESAVVGRVVALVTARDSDPGDNGKVHCSSKDVNFRLVLHESEYKVVVAMPLDREQIALHKVTIICQDGGTPPLKSSKLLLVKVLDSNDNSPQFLQPQYIMYAQENNNNVPVFIGQVSANDNDAGQNAEISYTIPESMNNTVIIEETSGKVFVNKTLDREHIAQYTIHVVASDHGSPPRTGQSLIILKVNDQNDNSPGFLNVSYAFYIKENVSPDSFVGLFVAKDEDEGINGEVSYYLKIVSETDSFPFRLLPNGSLVSAGSLDYEQKDMYHFEVFASDHGIPTHSASASVTVFVLDENDHRPRITFPTIDNNSVSVSHTAGAGTRIAVIQGHDADTGVNGQLLYSISVNNTSDLFLVDADAGVISLKRTLLSSEITTYELLITVSDRGTPALSAQAVLVVVVSFDDQLSDGYVKIVVAIVCVTLLLAVGVTVVVCFLRHTDKQNIRHGAITRNNFFSQCMNSLKSSRRHLKDAKQRPGIIVLGESNRFSKKTVTFKTNSPKGEKKNGSVKCENCKYQILKKAAGRVCSRCGTEEFNSRQMGESMNRSADVWFTSRHEVSSPGDSLQLENDDCLRHSEITV